MTNFNIYSSKFGQSTDDLPEGEVNLYLTNERIQAVIDSHTNLVKLTQLTWNNITNKPGTFPLSTHSHSWTEITSKPTTFTPSSHTHTIANVTGLQSTLDGKEPTFTKNTAFNKNFGTTTGTVTEGNDVRLSNARTPTSHTHTLSQITDSGNVAAIDTNGSTSNYLRGDGVWVTPPNTTYSAGTGLTLVGTEFRNTAPNVSTNLSTSTTSNTLTVNSSDGTNAVLPGATTALAGVMTGADKTKLNGIAAGAQVNVATNLTVSTTATNVTVNSSTGTNATIPAATTSIAGLLTSADKSKLNGIAAGAQVNVATNLGVTAGTTAGPVVTSSTGTNVTLPTASATNSGIITTGNQTWTGVKTFNSLITGSISGNAGTATALQTARTINGTSFNGSANITITANTPNTLTNGTGLTGNNFNGSAATTWAVAYGTTANTACQGNDSRLSDARNPTTHTHSNITLTAGDGLSGGGTLAANRTIDVDSTVVRTTGNQTLTGIKTFNITNNPVTFATNESFPDGNMLIDFNVWRGFDIRRIGSSAGSANLVLNSRVGANSWAFSHQGNYSMELEADANPRVFIYHGINFHQSDWRAVPNDRCSIQVYNGQTYFTKSSTLSSSGVHTRFRVGGTNVSYINDNGDYVKGSSDIKFKTILSKPTIGLSEINALTVTWFKYNELAAFHGFNPSTEQFGLIAQEVQNIYPNAVEVVENDHTDSPEVDDKKIDYLTIMYDKLIPLVIAAIQELSEKIDKLENMLNTQQ
ncbi:tail fiber domain-containing protein [Limnospira platensis CENA597]|uniref:tail fiber domain-containing protein n=1 Tax=Limnospira platensis TaxID=118562 RepID=UPI003DA0CBB0